MVEPITPVKVLVANIEHPRLVVRGDEHEWDITIPGLIPYAGAKNVREEKDYGVLTLEEIARRELRGYIEYDDPPGAGTSDAPIVIAPRALSVDLLSESVEGAKVVATATATIELPHEPECVEEEHEWRTFIVDGFSHTSNDCHQQCPNCQWNRILIAATKERTAGLRAARIERGYSAAKYYEGRRGIDRLRDVARDEEGRITLTARCLPWEGEPLAVHKLRIGGGKVWVAREREGKDTQWVRADNIPQQAIYDCIRRVSKLEMSRRPVGRER